MICKIETEQNIHEKIIAEIEKFSTIIISRHKLPDGDAYGSSHGLATLLRNKFREKRILIINEDQSDIGRLFEPEDAQISDTDYRSALLIVVDTANASRISNSKWQLAKQLIKIDHHHSTGDYGDLCLIDPTAASASEMVVRLGVTLSDTTTLECKKAAQYLYTGIATDTGRFRFPSTSEETFKAAAECIKTGIDIESIYEGLYLETFEQLSTRIKALTGAAHTRNGVIFLMFSLNEQKRLGLTSESAAALVGEISQIKESPIYAAFVEQPDGKWRCRLRARHIPIVEITERRSGGGHIYAAGCTVNSLEECNEVLDELDALIVTEE